MSNRLKKIPKLLSTIYTSDNWGGIALYHGFIIIVLHSTFSSTIWEQNQNGITEFLRLIESLNNITNKKKFKE